jgi:hypothetical protein
LKNGNIGMSLLDTKFETKVERQTFKAASGVTVYDDTTVPAHKFGEYVPRQSTISVSERTKNGPVYFSWILDHEASMGEVTSYADRLNTLQRNWIRLGRKVK